MTIDGGDGPGIKRPPRDTQWNHKDPENPLEISHEYGRNVHVLNDNLLLLLLARMGHPDTDQYTARRLAAKAYELLMGHVVGWEFPHPPIEVPTRMQKVVGDYGFYRGPAANIENVVVVSIERAGAIPTDSIVDLLTLATGGNIRRDSVTAERTTDAGGHVTGCKISGAKIGGPVEGATVIIPDVMAATGGTIEAVVELYTGKRLIPGTRKRLDAPPKRIVAMHLIAAPEYLRTVPGKFSDVGIYVARVDRGLSEKWVLQERLGAVAPAFERGLTNNGYIVPGAGGMGEMLSGEAKREPFYHHHRYKRGVVT